MRTEAVGGLLLRVRVEVGMCWAPTGGGCESWPAAQETHFFPSCPQGLPGGEGGAERGREEKASAFWGWFGSWPLLVWLDRPGSGVGGIREGPSSGLAKNGQ